MTATPPEPTPAAPVAPAVPPEPSTAVTAPQPPPGAAPANPADPAPTANPWDNPAAAQAEIERLRKENGAARTNAKAQAAEDARKEMAQTIGKALGLVEDEAIDPARLTESLTTAQADAKKAQVALAVYQNATAAGGDPIALLDSTTFLKAVDGIDPTDATAVATAIATAVAANPRLGAAPTDPRTPAPNPAQGSGASGIPDLAAQIAAANAKGDWQTAVALETQKLIAAPKP